jgi:Holliday junction resolvase-like predicted endonuclease
MKMERKHLPFKSELVACAWLLGEGYEVFRNVSLRGPIDIVAYAPETATTLLIDVKTYCESYQNSTPVGEPERRERNIVVLMVDRETGECWFHKAPTQKIPRVRRVNGQLAVRVSS